MPSSSSSSSPLLPPPFVGLGPRLAALPRRGLGELRAHLFFRGSSRPIVGHRLHASTASGGQRCVLGQPLYRLRRCRNRCAIGCARRGQRVRTRPAVLPRPGARGRLAARRRAHSALGSSTLRPLATAEPWKPRPAAKALKYHGLTGSAAPARESPASSPSPRAAKPRRGPSRRTPG